MHPFAFEEILANTGEALFTHCRQTCAELLEVLYSVVQGSAEPLIVAVAGIWLCVCVWMKVAGRLAGASRRPAHGP